MTFDLEFKEALKLLADVEKDKLILRLLKHDKKLTKKLHFELIETESIENKREQIINLILQITTVKSSDYFNDGYIIQDIKTMSGLINEHVYITKDKYGEISLNSFLILNLLEHYNQKIEEASYSVTYKLCIYIIARMFKVLLLIQKQHMDLHIEFKENIESIGRYIANNQKLMAIAINNGLDVNWLTQYNIPENLNDIYTNIRQSGFLR